MTDVLGQGVDRRSVLLGSFSLGAALFMGGAPVGAAEPPLPPLHGGALDTSSFLALSRSLTGHDELDEDMGNALLDALQEAGHGHGLQLLYGDVAQSDGSAAAIAAAAAGREAAARALLRGWYVGLVRMTDGSERLVGYEDSLMGAVVADFIPLRSFCGGEPHFWAEPPALADLPL